MLRHLLIALTVTFAAGCAPDTGGKPLPVVSDDKLLQRAFESCVVDNVKEMRSRNPDLPSSLESSTMTPIHHNCEIAVVHTCERNKETEACQLVLAMYIKLH